MRIVYKAQRQLKAIASKIAEDRPLAAVRLVRRINDHFVLMATTGMAEIGAPGRVAGTRHIVEGRYVAVYRFEPVQDQITILSVVHGARRR